MVRSETVKGVECEFAFRLRGLDATSTKQQKKAPYTRQTVTELVVDLMPAIEIAGSRFAQNSVPSPLLIADFGGNVGLILGVPAKQLGVNWRELNLASHMIRLRKNGVEVAEGRGSHALGHPLEALAWTVNHILSRGQSITDGCVVSTGTCTGLVPVAAKDMFEGDFGRLGSIVFEFRPDA